MSLNNKKILIIDDNHDVRLSAGFLLGHHGVRVLEADSPVTGLAQIRQQLPDLILLDLNFSLDTTSGEEGLYCLRKIRELDDTLPVIVITAWANTELVVKALKTGATDFIEKPWDNQRLLQVINQALRLSQLEQQSLRWQQQAAERNAPIELITHSEPMRRLKQQLDALAPTEATLLLTGENGTGKSTLARYLHQQSTRREQEMISVNMGALPENLFESEMFGHIKGAFTGAHQTRIGRFELAQGSSLFLDEVANIPLSQQVKLLRVLESGEFEPVGSSQTRSARVRLISASNADFPALLASGAFRQDLYFRLNTLELRVPSLRERVDDIPDLARTMLIKLCRDYNRPMLQLNAAAITQLCRYPFPGNLRELSHILERLVLLHPGQEVGAADLNLPMPPSDSRHQGQGAIPEPERACLSMMTLEMAERRLLDMALSQSQGQIPAAAQLLGLSKSAIYRRLEKYRMVAKDYQS